MTKREIIAAMTSIDTAARETGYAGAIDLYVKLKDLLIALELNEPDRP